MYEGMMILYKVSPLFGIKMRWATEITHIQPKKFFVDEQRSGPFAMWHHEHHFEEVEGGVKMTDLLHYAVPLGPLGALANPLFVKDRVEEIFRFRDQAVDRLFP
jgi:ligand-binding SRPBCC domain-containing protein